MSDVNPKMHRGFKIRKTSVQPGHKSNITPIRNRDSEYTIPPKTKVDFPKIEKAKYDS